eukprot:GFUD01041000.1.p1 GENE.GFUD01041000.1~~GFUD01041000.1.p1  ORF type:complete len:488 (+),score=115.60 GFUD01041000.1:149-1612(+)
MQLLLLCLAVSANAVPQGINFGGPVASTSTSTTTKKPKPDINQRLGLLANSLGLDPTAAQNQQAVATGSSSAFTDGSNGQASGRIPQGGEFGGNGGNGGQQCCCVPVQEQCGDPLGREDLVGSGLIDPRLKDPVQAAKDRLKSDISIRIVNRPVANTNAQQSACPVGQKTCCYDNDINLSIFGITCINPQQANNAIPWTQGCGENSRPSNKECGTRSFPRPATGLKHGEASPGEFPWTCLLLNQNNDFIGSCAIIPNDFSNDNNRGTRKVITAAHKLKKIKERDLLKVRVGEYDASGFNDPEKFNHEEYTVTRILKHPDFSAGRLDNDIALLFVEKDIDLNSPYVNTACLPSCDNQFDYQFNNGTGIRCWVAGWGKNEFDGSFQFLQHKVDIPLVDSSTCNRKLKTALNNQKRGVGDRFNLSPSEICAGAEVGKDACTGDGGSPLVCQAQSGRWTVMGLVTWGVGCASDLPGVYARMSYFRDWINAN